MKKFIYIIYPFLFLGIIFQSCKNPEKKKLQKNRIEELTAKDCACIHADSAVYPPPFKNSILKSDEVKIIEEKKSYYVKLELIADQIIDYQGNMQQIFRIESDTNRTLKINRLQLH